jgi:hypothetical protein
MLRPGAAKIATTRTRVLEASPGSESAERDRKVELEPGLVLNFLIQPLPWAVLVVTALVAISGVSDPMFLTGLLAAAAASFLFQALLLKTPQALERLWRQESINGEPASFDQFVRILQRQLNSRWSWLTGALIAILMFVSFPTRFALRGGGWRHPLDWLTTLIGMGRWDYILAALLQVLLALVLGLLLWRMLVVAFMIAGVGRRFQVAVQPRHPDGAGGLRSLGDLCLINALILSAPAIYLAGWLILIPGFGPQHRYQAYVHYYYLLLMVVFVLAVCAFVLPAYFVHRAMVEQKARLEVPLFELSARIDDLTRRLMRGVGTEPPEDLAKLSGEREALQQLYASDESIPVWPFDAAILRRFTIAQFIPLLSLTGLAPNIVTALQQTFPR